MTGRILCLGDSLTYGFGLPRGLVWTALCAAQTGAELLGWGVNGNTTGGMLAVLPDLLVREHPDAVLLMGGTNDIAYGGDLAGARANMGAMAHLIIAGGGLPLIGIPPGLRRPIRREWAELMPERAAELLAEYQSWLRRFAAAFRLPPPQRRRPLPDGGDGRGAHSIPVRERSLCHDACHPKPQHRPPLQSGAGAVYF